ncbi:MAG: dienelactone hydrolase family protein [Acidimicrobiia bacterium]|nr:dienelactone hydrolase family protein [Acidimicrobiia bacterium]MDH5236255.1 dienelactone hydrolase family protein [Acidimicrobiia bacterium]
MEGSDQRLRDRAVTLAGVRGRTVEVASANPVNFHHAITDPGGCEPITIDGMLFLAGDGPTPLVMVVPGSLGVGPNHLAHAETLVASGFAAFLLDPFGARSVASTVGNQTQYSFAASAFDVLAALRVLADDPAIDRDRISAQGHSRGGSAVLTASMRRFADAVAGPDLALAGTYAVYPWAGYQFVDPDVGRTRVRSIVGELDEWVSVQQVQAQTRAIALRGGVATDRIVAGAHHSFDRHEPVHELPEARIAPGAPTVHLTDDGAMIHPHTGEPDRSLTDTDLFITAVEAGFGRKGARIGGIGDQPALFEADMLAFHRDVLGAP